MIIRLLQIIAPILDILVRLIWIISKITGYFWKLFARIDKFKAGVFLALAAVIFDQLLISESSIQNIDSYISSYEATAAILLSALLVLLYHEQQKIQESQKGLLEEQTKFTEVQQSPIILIEELSVEDDYLYATIKNIGNGPALNLRLFVCMGFPQAKPKYLDESPQFINESNFTNSITPAEGACTFSTELTYISFPLRREKDGNGRIMPFLDNEREKYLSRTKMCLVYDNISGTRHYIDLFRLIDLDVSSDIPYEKSITSSEVHDLSEDRKDIVVSKTALDDIR